MMRMTRGSDHGIVMYKRYLVMMVRWIYEEGLLRVELDSWHGHEFYTILKHA